jgi:hypothetical protein
MTHPPLQPWRVAIAGMLSLAVAMGIGRFAFTPLLPMMLADGAVDLPAASWLASANYLGYLVGALLCTLPAADLGSPGHTATGRWSVHGRSRGLVATTLLTLAWRCRGPRSGRCCVSLPASPAHWSSSTRRAGAWRQLARRGDAALGGAIYTGPGAGIIVSGLFASAMVAWHWHAASGWLIFGVLAFVLTAAVWRTIRSELPLRRRAAHACDGQRPWRRSTACGTPLPGWRLWPGGLRLHHHRHLPAGDCACSSAGFAMAGFVLAALRPRRDRRCA